MNHIEIVKHKIQRSKKTLWNLIWPKEPNGDYYRLLDFIAAVGASRFVPKTPRQERILLLWKIYRWFCVYHTTFLVLNGLEHLDRWGDIEEFAWFVMIGVEVLMAHVKDLLLVKNSKLIQNAQCFINEQAATVFDSLYDSDVRNKHFRNVQLMCSGIALIAFTMFMMMVIPNAQMREYFPIPGTFMKMPLTAMGANVLYFLFKITLAPPWPCKIVCSTALITSVLDGFKTELDIFAHELGSTVERVHLASINDFYGTETRKDQPFEEIVFMNLKTKIIQNITYHVKLLEKLQEFQPFAEVFFFVLYVHAMALIGTYLFVILQAKFSIGSAMILMAVTAYFVKCYFWCWVINSFQDVNEVIAEHIMNLITAIPYSNANHVEYGDLRSSLMIMMIRTQTSAQFSCGGVAVISVQIFGKLLNISYTVITFLLNIT